MNQMKLGLRPQYIVFEGVDGAGKSTQSALLSSYLTSKDIPYVTTREPGSPHIGLNVRDFVLSDRKIDKMALELLMCADRAEHTTWVKDQLATGKWVISDRSFISGFAYGFSCGLSFGDLVSIYRLSIKIYPDHVFYLQLSASEIEHRLTLKHSKTREESKGCEFLRQVSREFDWITDYFKKTVPCTTLWGNDEVSSLHERVKQELSLGNL